MKIDELRKAILHHSSDDLRLLVVELYKRLPRAKAAEEDLEQILQNPALLRQPKAARPKKEPVIDMDGLSSEVSDFITDARAGNYYGPNRIISKAERMRWRFEAMRFRKELLEKSGQPKLSSAKEVWDELVAGISQARAPHWRFRQKAAEPLFQVPHVPLLPVHNFWRNAPAGRGRHLDPRT